MIPKNIHFIYPVTDKTRPWSMVNDLSVETAFHVYPEHQIYIWTNNLYAVPFNNMGHGRINVCEIDLPTHIGDAEIVWPQYASDVMRLQILLDYGGIYMDTDIINLRQFTPPDENTLTFCWETPKCESICNAIMFAPKGNQFIKSWLDRMPAAMSHPTWAYGGVVVPYEMANDPSFDPYHSAISSNAFCPLDLSKNWMFDPALKAEAKERVGSSYAVHVFETYWRDIIKDITPEWIRQNDCLFSELVRM